MRNEELAKIYKKYQFQNFLGFFSSFVGRHFLFLNFSNNRQISGNPNCSQDFRKRSRSRWYSISCCHNLPRKFNLQGDFGTQKCHGKFNRLWVKQPLRHYVKIMAHHNFFSPLAVQLFDLLHDHHFTERFNVSHQMKNVFPTLRKYFFDDGFLSAFSTFRDIQGVPFSFLLTNWGLCLNFNLQPMKAMLNSDK